MDIILLEAQRLQWSLNNLKEATAIGSLRKLESEIKEIESDIEAGIKRPEEYADALMCLFDVAGREGIGVEEIFSAYKEKFEVNKKRTWKYNGNGSYSHIKQNNLDHITADNIL